MKHDPYGPFSGIKDALALLTMLSDAKKRKECLDIISGLEEERLKINKSIEVYASLGEIDALRGEEKHLRDLAKKAVERAKVRATEIEDEARLVAKDAAEGLRQLALDKSKFMEKERELASREQALENGKKVMADAMKVMEAREAAARRAEEAGKKAKAVYEGKVEALRKGTG